MKILIVFGLLIATLAVAIAHPFHATVSVNRPVAQETIEVAATFTLAPVPTVSPSQLYTAPRAVAKAPVTKTVSVVGKRFVCGQGHEMLMGPAGKLVHDREWI